MKTSTYINDLMQASFFPALIIWTVCILVIGIVDTYIISIALPGNENWCFGISAVIAYALACYFMHSAYGEQYRKDSF
ncbi:MAG: hypothetical protein MRY57_00520 [Candidatus Pacebacteria bacterium]|nr:hypothetical protein [Candidatus Paceibacterota bacterium]